MDKDKFNDRGYKMLFSHPQMMEDLIKSFVKEEFIKEIDFTTLKLVRNSFVTRSFKNRESDIIWKVKIMGKISYIYLLLEFQSTIDKFMSLRLLTYIGLFYEHLLKKRKKVEKLPSVFPIVLYNGDDKWSAPLNIDELIDIPFYSLKPYIPSFKYYKIAENEFSKKSLLEMENLVSGLFLLETSDIKDIGDIIKRILVILKKEVTKELQIDFGLWVRGILRKKNFHIDLSKLDEMEVRPMLLANLEKFEKEIFEKGLEKGREEGMEKGMEKGIEKSKIFIAKNLLKKNILSIEEISEITGISVNKIKTIN